jgi:predicted cupin superfamily sugar epimerase
MTPNEEYEFYTHPETRQSARPVDSQKVLVSCVVFPGFDFDDFTLA